MTTASRARRLVRSTLTAGLTAGLTATGLTATGLTVATPAAHAASVLRGDWIMLPERYIPNAVYDQTVADNAVWAVGAHIDANTRDYLGVRVNRVDVTRAPVDYGDVVLDLPVSDIAEKTRLNIEGAGDGFVLAVDRGASYELRSYTAAGSLRATHKVPVGAGARNGIYTDSTGDAVVVAVTSPAAGTITLHTSTDAGATWTSHTHTAAKFAAANRRIAYYDGSTVVLSWRDDAGIVHVDTLTGNQAAPTVARRTLPGGLYVSPVVARTRGDGTRVLNWYSHPEGSANQTLFEDTLDSDWTNPEITNPAVDAATWTILGDTTSRTSALRVPAISDTMFAAGPSSNSATNVFARTATALVPETAVSDGSNRQAPTDWVGPIGLASVDMAQGPLSGAGQNGAFYRPEQLPQAFSNAHDGVPGFNEPGTIVTVELWAAQPATCTLTGNGATYTPETDARIVFAIPTQRAEYYQDDQSCGVVKADLEPGTWTLTLTGDGDGARPGAAPKVGFATVTFTVTGGAGPDPDDPDPTDPDPDDPDPTDPDVPSAPPLQTFLNGPRVTVAAKTAHTFVALSSKDDVTHQWQTAELNTDGTLGTVSQTGRLDGSRLTQRLRPGTGTCVRVQAFRDATGQVSDWTPWKCVVAAADDRAMGRSRGPVARSNDAGAYLRTVTVLRQAGSGVYGLRTGAADTVTLVFRKARTSGRVLVAVGRHEVGSVDIRRGAGAQKETLDLNGRRGVVKVIRVGRTGPAELDAIALWHSHSPRGGSATDGRSPARTSEAR